MDNANERVDGGSINHTVNREGGLEPSRTNQQPNNHQSTDITEDSKTTFQVWQVRVGAVLESRPGQIITIVLVILELILIVIEIANNKCDVSEFVEILSDVVSSYFVVEVSLRIFHMGKSFFSERFNIFDMVVVFTSFGIAMASIAAESGDHSEEHTDEECERSTLENWLLYAKLILIGRAIRVYREGLAAYKGSNHSNHSSRSAGPYTNME